VGGAAPTHSVLEREGGFMKKEKGVGKKDKVFYKED